MMKQTLGVRLGQHVAITPQLREAIKLMRLSTVELKQVVMRSVEANPMLELEEYADDDDPDPDPADPAMRNDGDDWPSGADDQDAEEAPPDLAEIPEDLAVDVSWDDIYQPAGHAAPADPEANDGFEERVGAAATLRDDLLWQLHLAPLSPRQRSIAFVVIDGIDDNGMLTAPTEDLLAALDPEVGCEEAEIEEAIAVVQRFDPPGVGARCLAECLLLQLRRLPEDTPWRATAQVLIRDHFDLLASQEIAALARRAKLSLADIEAALALVRSLHPRPGSAVGDARVDYVEPDVSVSKKDGRWTVELNRAAMPRVRVNGDYPRLIKADDKSADNLFLKNNLQDAKWLLKNLEYRNETLLKVAANIVERQRGFLERGEEAMEPMVLADVAAAVDRHESTISRVTTRKYMDTPRGVFELKYFFSSHVGTASGGEKSSTAIRALIKKLVANEDLGKPLSDMRIATILRERGIRVARRTVAKYREGMTIPTSHERKRAV